MKNLPFYRGKFFSVVPNCGIFHGVTRVPRAHSEKEGKGYRESTSKR